MESSKQRGNQKGPTSAAVANAVRRARQAREMDLAELSTELQRLKWPIPVAALSRLENGNRRVDVDDLFALANALKVPPIHLLLPNQSDENFGTTIPQDADYAEVHAWIHGDLKTFEPGDRMFYWEGVMSEVLASLPKLAEKVASWKEASLRDPGDRNIRQYAAMLKRELKEAEALKDEAQSRVAELQEVVDRENDV